MNLTDNTEQIGNSHSSPEPKIGEFKTKDKFIEFIGIKGNINFITDEATIDGKYLSGLDFNDIKFKLTICDNNTVNFEEIDTNKTNREQRQRLLDIISDKSITPYRQKMVINELQFISTNTFRDKHITCYLSIENQTPMNKLLSLIDDENENININESQSSKLDDLLNLFGDDIPEEISVDKIDREVENDIIKSSPDKIENDFTKDSFKKMKEDKITELEKRIENRSKDISKFESDTRQSQKKVDDAKEDVRLLQSRLESLYPPKEPNGYIFNVSQELNQKLQLDDVTSKFIFDKISKIKSINAEAFMKIFEQGEYQIKLSLLEDPILEIDYKSIPENITESLNKNEISLTDNKLMYIGDTKWHGIIDKLLKEGFSQNTQFDKNCDTYYKDQMIGTSSQTI